MTKKIISLLVIFAMLVPFSSAVAADEPTSQPTIEEILNDYHQKAFEEQTPNDTSGASTWSRSGSGSTKTLEQETVDTLTEAGYEAYNVTADNYASLETALNTDFAEMGLDPDGSYIIVVSGEEYQPSVASSRIIGNPGGSDIIQKPGDLEGGSYFEYTYEGTTYYMRYLTITAANNSELGMTSTADLLDEFGMHDALAILDLPMTVLSFFSKAEPVTTIFSLLSLIPNVDVAEFSTLNFTAGTNWTIKYTQVYDSLAKEWKDRASVEYVTRTYFINYTYYDTDANKYTQESYEGSLPIQYSENYNNDEIMKSYTIFALEYDSIWRDTVEEIEYQFDGKNAN